MNKTILVTGGAGYIGSHVVLQLLDKGYGVRVFDNFSSGIRANVAPEAEVVEGDILNEAQLSQALAGVDCVIHLAAKKSVADSFACPHIYAQNNIIGTINLLNAMREKKIKYFIFSSSAAVYGSPLEGVGLDETAPLSPCNFYGFTKTVVDNMLPWYKQTAGINYLSLRYFNAAGYDMAGRITCPEKNAQNLLPVVLEAAVGKRACLEIFGRDYSTPDGTCIRDYVHVSDLARAHILGMSYLFQGGASEVVNLGTAAGTSVLEVVKAACHVTGQEIKIRFAGRREGDPAVLTASNAKAQKLLDWRPKNSSMEDIISSMLSVYEKILVR